MKETIELANLFIITQLYVIYSGISRDKVPRSKILFCSAAVWFKRLSMCGISVAYALKHHKVGRKAFWPSTHSKLVQLQYTSLTLSENNDMTPSTPG